VIDILFQKQDGFGGVVSSKTIDDRTGRLADRSGNPVETLKHNETCGGLCGHDAQDEKQRDELHSVENRAHGSLLSSRKGLKLCPPLTYEFLCEFHSLLRAHLTLIASNLKDNTPPTRSQAVLYDDCCEC
jgi:hypothetical protein